MKAHIVDAVNYCKLTLTNLESTRGRRNFNKYVTDYPTQFDTNFLKQHLIIETAVFFRAYPTENKKQIAWFIIIFFRRLLSCRYYNNNIIHIEDLYEFISLLMK